jgi:hypothetical protein
MLRCIAISEKKDKLIYTFDTKQQQQKYLQFFHSPGIILLLVGGRYMFSILRYHTIDPNLELQYEVKLLIKPKQILF